MPVLKKLLSYLFGLSVGGFTALFGGYLVYEKVILSIQIGATTERIGVIERASDPFWFWVSVLMYGFFGTVIALGGLSFLAWVVRTAINSGFSSDQ